MAVLACLLLLFQPSVTRSAPPSFTGTAEGGFGTAGRPTFSIEDARLPSLLGVYAQAVAYGADSSKPPKKGAREFFQEFLDLFLKVLVSIGFIANILAAVKLWLDERAARRRRKELRICPQCYNPVRRRNATRCPHCRGELAAVSPVAGTVPRPVVSRIGARSEEPLRRTQPQRPVRGQPVREESRETQQVEERIAEQPTCRESAPLEPGPAKPVREEPLIAARQEAEGEEWEEEEEDWQDDLEQEAQARRRKELVYAFVLANLFGWLAAALLYFFGRL